MRNAEIFGVDKQELMRILQILGVSEFPMRPTYQFFGDWIENFVYDHCPDKCTLLIVESGV